MTLSQIVKNILTNFLFRFKERIFRFTLILKNRKEFKIEIVYLFIIAMGLLLVLLPNSVAAEEDEKSRIMNIVLYIMQLIIRFFRRLISYFLPAFAALAEACMNTQDVLKKNGDIAFTWGIVRDITNIFFVLLFLIISLGTILKIESYHIRKLLPMFIIAVLFVNFSFLICNILIDGSQIVMNEFSKNMPNATEIIAVGVFSSTKKISDSPLFKLTSHYPGVISTESTVKVMGLTVLLFTTLVFIGVLGFSFAAVSIFLVIRIVVLWFLTVLSPFAFLFMILPQTQSIAKKWWSSFIKYIIFGPAMTFFVYLSTRVIQNTNRGEMETLIEKAQNNLTGLGEEGSGGAILEGDSAKLFIKLVFIAGSLIIGILISRQLGIAGAGAITGFGMGLGRKVGGAVTAPARWAMRAPGYLAKKAITPAKGPHGEKLPSPLGRLARRIPGVRHIPAGLEAFKERRALRRAEGEKELNLVKEKWGNIFNTLGEKRGFGWLLGVNPELASKMRYANDYRQGEEIAKTSTPPAIQQAFNEAISKKNESEARKLMIALCINGSINNQHIKAWKDTFKPSSETQKRMNLDFEDRLVKDAISAGNYNVLPSSEVRDSLTGNVVSKLESQFRNEELSKLAQQAGKSIEDAKRDKEIVDRAVQSARTRIGSMSQQDIDTENNNIRYRELARRLSKMTPENFHKNIDVDMISAIKDKIDRGEPLSGEEKIVMVLANKTSQHVSPSKKKHKINSILSDSKVQSQMPQMEQDVGQYV